MQLLKCRRHRARVDFFRSLRQSHSLRFGESRGKIRERFQKCAGQWIGGNQIRNLLRNIAKHQLRRGITALESFLQKRKMLLDGFRQAFQPCQNIFKIRNRPARHVRKNRRSALLDASHLVQWHPFVARHHVPERQRVIAILQALFRRFEQLAVQVVVQHFLRWERIAGDIFQRRKALVQMFSALLNAFGGIVRPAAVLPRKSHFRRHFRIFGHPALPILIQVSAKLLRGLGLRVACILAAPSHGDHRNHKHSAANSQRQHEQHAHHDSLPAAFANSFSRSCASIRMSRAVSSASIAVLSTSKASTARTSGETLRSRSRRSRSRTSTRTSARVNLSPFSWCSFQRRSARTSGEASRKILSSARGNTTVPMSRPSMTTPPPAPARCCSATSTLRTAAMVASSEAALATSAVRIASVTSLPSRKTRFFAPAASCSGVGGLSSMWVSRAMASSPASSSSATFRFSAFSASARYIAPLSRYVYPSSAATRRATVLLPEPAGPSMVMVSFCIGGSTDTPVCALFSVVRRRKHCCLEQRNCSEPHDVVAAIDVKRFAGDSRSRVGEKKCRRRSHFRRIHVSLER